MMKCYKCNTANLKLNDLMIVAISVLTLSTVTENLIVVILR